MDHCELCFDRPEPLACQVEGRFRIDAVDGPRRLLGELEVRAPTPLHFVEVGAARRSWRSGGRVLQAVTVYNRSSLPMDRLTLSTGGGDFLPGTVRVNGLLQEGADPAGGVVIPGLDAGCEVVVTWQEVPPDPSAGEETSILIRYEYRFGEERLDGRIRA